MEKKKTLIIVSVLLVVLIGGASLLYTKLGDKLKPDNLLIQNDTGNTNDRSDTAMPGTTGGNGSADNDGTSGNENTAGENSFSAAPDFTVYDRAGNPVQLSDFFGKPVVVNFWASWCGPCKSEMPDFEEIYQEYKDEVHFLMVNLTDGNQETMVSATTFLDNSGYTFPVYYDKDSDAAYTYQVYAIPATYFINAKGELVARGTSALDAETIKRGIGMILE